MRKRTAFPDNVNESNWDYAYEKTHSKHFIRENKANENEYLLKYASEHKKPLLWLLVINIITMLFSFIVALQGNTSASLIFLLAFLLLSCQLIYYGMLGLIALEQFIYKIIDEKNE